MSLTDQITLVIRTLILLYAFISIHRTDWSDTNKRAAYGFLFVIFTA